MYYIEWDLETFKAVYVTIQCIVETLDWSVKMHIKGAFETFASV